MPHIEDRLPPQMMRPDLLMHHVPLPSLGWPRRRRGRGSSRPSTGSASAAPRRARLSIAASGLVRGRMADRRVRVARVSVGVARHLPESLLGTPMVRPNPAIPMGRRKALPRRSAMPPESPEPRPSPVAQPSAARTGWWPDRTSRPEPPTNGRKQCRSGYSERPPSLPSRRPRERERVDPPNGAKDREAHAHRSLRSVDPDHGAVLPRCTIAQDVECAR